MCDQHQPLEGADSTPHNSFLPVILKELSLKTMRKSNQVQPLVERLMNNGSLSYAEAMQMQELIGSLRLMMAALYEAIGFGDDLYAEAGMRDGN